jgi:hypothetical protein
MRSMSAIFAAASVALGLGSLTQPAAAQQNNQDYSTLPGYSARPPGMCWHREFGSGHDDNGYWGACKNESTSAQAQAQAPNQTPQRSRTRRR